jgi:glycosyltransferase involved in cell wall biosynthesis
MLTMVVIPILLILCHNIMFWFVYIHSPSTVEQAKRDEFKAAMQSAKEETRSHKSPNVPRRRRRREKRENDGKSKSKRVNDADDDTLDAVDDDERAIDDENSFGSAWDDANDNAIVVGVNDDDDDGGDEKKSSSVKGQRLLPHDVHDTDPVIFFNCTTFFFSSYNLSVLCLDKEKTCGTKTKSKCWYRRQRRRWRW